MKLPNADRAFIDLGKLTEYCLDPEHERGGHKAVLFRSVMGLGGADAGVLAGMLRAWAVEDEVDLTRESPYGVVYVLHHPLAGTSPARQLRHVWLVRHSEDFPRLVTCYPVRHL